MSTNSSIPNNRVAWRAEARAAKKRKNAKSSSIPTNSHAISASEVAAALLQTEGHLVSEAPSTMVAFSDAAASGTSDGNAMAHAFNLCNQDSENSDKHILDMLIDIGPQQFSKSIQHDIRTLDELSNKSTKHRRYSHKHSDATCEGFVLGWMHWLNQNDEPSLLTSRDLGDLKAMIRKGKKAYPKLGIWDTTLEDVLSTKPTDEDLLDPSKYTEKIDSREFSQRVNSFRERIERNSKTGSHGSRTRFGKLLMRDMDIIEKQGVSAIGYLKELENTMDHLESNISHEVSALGGQNAIHGFLQAMRCRRKGLTKIVGTGEIDMTRLSSRSLGNMYC